MLNTVPSRSWRHPSRAERHPLRIAVSGRRWVSRSGIVGGSTSDDPNASGKPAPGSGGQARRDVAVVTRPYEMLAISA